ncbi:hypothetical protein CKALI_08780 [Corynebacterium kalinowskii]|uniref:Uncharacterized protein n=1 Tax=Corynebacterium kalinowskii TaxID=2675216 RepID=A0A6B8VUI9_9CORY|nr:hypothetical protein [Corynebacterium kalinowskii]QGU02615.1 hypothetical protein CKALI_08780 [Corynebacterium kalinowskii]
MAKIEKNSYVDPGWPEHLPETSGHPVTELVSRLAGASSPYGDDMPFPLPAEKIGYVHPYTQINK